jgi:hypothetical protein
VVPVLVWRGVVGTILECGYWCCGLYLHDDFAFEDDAMVQVSNLLWFEAVYTLAFYVTVVWVFARLLVVGHWCSLVSVRVVPCAVLIQSIRVRRS